MHSEYYGSLSRNRTMENELLVVYRKAIVAGFKNAERVTVPCVHPTPAGRGLPYFRWLMDLDDYQRQREPDSNKTTFHHERFSNNASSDVTSDDASSPAPEEKNASNASSSLEKWIHSWTPWESGGDGVEEMEHADVQQAVGLVEFDVPVEIVTPPTPGKVEEMLGREWPIQKRPSESTQNFLSSQFFSLPC